MGKIVKCQECETEFEAKYENSKALFCSAKCRKLGAEKSYTAKNIKILEAEDILEKFDWAKLGALAEQYNAPVEWIERGFNACQQAGVDFEYFIDRYLKKDKTVPFHEGVDEAYRDLYLRNVNERWRRNSR